jgi:glycogen debranching enzyme
VESLALEAPVRTVFARNRVSGRTPGGVPYRFHCPDASKFPAQFLWDSCWHAIALARIDPPAAREELRTLLRAQEEDGFVPHTILWHRPVRPSRALLYNFAHLGDRTTRTIHPPFVAFAWEIVADASSDDPGFRTEAVGRLAAMHDWLERERDPDRSGLVAIISPDESGLDASPKFDHLMGRLAAGRSGFVWHVHQLRRDGFRLDRVLARGGFCVQEVLATTAHALSLRSLARLSGDGRFAERAVQVERSLLDHLWDDERGLFFDRVVADGRLERVSTWASLAPLALAHLPRTVAERLAAHLSDPAAYALPHPVPSTSAAEPSFARRTRGIPRYWRGPTWIVSSWLLHRGLREHGLADTARHLAERTVRLAVGSGLREYYDPCDGTPQGAQGFGMSTLALDLEHHLRADGS